MTSRLLALWEICILITHWWPKSIPKHQMGLHGVGQRHMTYFSWNRWKMLTSAKNHMKSGQTHNIWKEQHDSFPMRGYSSKSVKWFRNRAIQMFGTKKMTSATNFRHSLQTSQRRKFCEIAWECVKLNFMKCKVWRMGNELLTKNLTG